MRLRGVFAVVATPFNTEGCVDEGALRRVVQFCLQCGVHGLVWPAVAGEFYSLSDDERKRFIRVVIDETSGRVPVVAGTSGCSTAAAVALTEDAGEAGADAVMVLPPYVVHDDEQGILRYLAETCRAAAGNPVILQSTGPPLGQSLSPSVVASLVRRVEGLTHVKVETIPSGHAISGVIAAAGPSLQGVFGGGGGRYLVDEYLRGACGVMPACEYSDVFVAIWNYLETGQLDAARAVFECLLPLLMMQAAFRVTFSKEVLKRRGVLDSVAVRIGAGLALDDFDHRELDALTSRIAPFIRVCL